MNALLKYNRVDMISSKVRDLGFLCLILLILQLPVAATEFDNTHLITDAANGDPEAQYTLAHLNLKGQGGIKRNTTAGVGLLEQAVSKGHKEAALDLALLYLNGIKVPKDNVKALVWLRKAADLEQVDAQYYLGLAYKSVDGTEALRWLRMAGKNGHAEAANEVKVICHEAPELCK